MLTWGVMSLSAYPLMVFLVSKVSKRETWKKNKESVTKREKNEKQKVADHR